MVTIQLHDLTKAFETKSSQKRVLGGVSLSISSGEVVAIRGDNGTGKTTLLNIIAGIERRYGGMCKFAGLPREAIRIGYVQQDYTSSLLPWLNVLANISVPLQLRGIPKTERRGRAAQLLESLGFGNVPRGAYPYQLSGGQKQRVVIARALVHKPHVLLLDEPFANLDAHTTRDLQQVLLNIHQTQRPTIICVSHELDHCIYLADRVVLLAGSPARVGYDISVPLSRPRKREMILTEESARIRSRILSEEEGFYARTS